MAKITDEQIEELGKLADKAANFLAGSFIPCSDSIHVAAMRGGMRDIRNELRALVVKLGNGENPWEFEPPDPPGMFEDS